MLNCALYGLVRFYILASRCLGPEFPGDLLLLFGLLVHGHRGAVRARAEELPPPAGVFARIDHAGIMVTGARLRRQARRARR